MVWYEDESCKSLTLTLKTSNTFFLSLCFMKIIAHSEHDLKRSLVKEL